MRLEAGVQVGRAFAPGHVTALFSPSVERRDPLARGSIGAGIVLEIGVRAVARWRPGGRTLLRVRADVPGALPISRDAARRVLGRRLGTLEVELLHQLPIEQGFGMSAAGATATALAVADVLGMPRRAAVESAHLADLLGGGGLGGVAAILGGGMEHRDRAGLPPTGHVRHSPFPEPVFLAIAGPPIPSPALLRDPAFLERVRSTAAPELSALGDAPEARELLASAERFGDDLGLMPPGLARTIRDLRGPDVRVAQAMFGQSLFAVPFGPSARRRLVKGLADQGLSSVEVRASARGAHRLT